jgi:epimerase transport system membrane fusion protein
MATSRALHQTGPERETLQQLEAESAKFVRAGLGLLLLAALPVAAWLGFAPLASAVVAPGHVKVDTNRTPVQHADGGTVREVLVRDGQRVKAGDPMIVLGDVRVDADMQRWDARVNAERTSVARLEAEQAMLGAMRVPEDLLRVARQDPGLAELIDKERSLFDTRRRALQSQIGLLQDQRAKVADEAKLLSAQIERAEEALRLQQSELATNRRLLNDGFISSTRVTQIEAQVADYGVKLEERRSERVRADQRMLDSDLRIKSLESEYRQQASDQLKVTLARLAEIQQEQRKTSDAASRQVIKAPAGGDVIGLRVTAPGAVVRAQDVLAEIVPTEKELVVEARLRPEDIERVRLGQAANVRFTAFSYRSTPLVTGTVHYVSADRWVDQQSGVAYYIARIRVAADALSAAGELQLLAGMPAEIYIEGPARTPLEYMLQPITDIGMRAGRER